MKTARVVAVTAVFVHVGAAVPVHAEMVSYLPGMLLGRGFDTVSGMVKSDCIGFQATDMPTQAAQSVTWNWQEISSNSDILSLTSVDASASMNYGLFSASAEMGLLSQSQISNYSVNVLAQVSVEQKWNIATNSTIKGNYSAVLQENQDQFMSQCGNRYIAGILYGGAFYGLIKVTTTSQLDKEKVTVGLRASYGSFGSGQGSVSEESIETMNSHETTITGYATGSGPSAIPMTVDQLRTRAANFPVEVQASGGAPIRVILAEYQLINAPINPLLYELASLRWDYASAKREIQYVLENPNQFYMDLSSWRSALNGWVNSAQRAITAIDAAMTACRQNGICTRPVLAKTPEDLRGSLPPRYISECGTKTFAFSGFSMEVTALGTRCGGDTEMDGHNPYIYVRSTIEPQVNGKIINVNTHVKMKEGKKDWTCFEDRRTSTFMNLDLTYPGCYLGTAADCTPPDGALSARGGEDNHSWTQYGGGSGLVLSANCLSDTKGGDSGKLGCRNIRFQDASVKLRHDEDKMGPNQLAQSARSDWRNKARIFRQIQEIRSAQTTKQESVVDAVVKKTGATLEVPSHRTHDAEKPVVPRFRTQGQAGGTRVLPW